MFPADTALEQFSMAVPHHVRLELRLVGELDPAHAADQSFPGSQRLYVLLEIHIFVQIHLLLDRGATPPLLPPLVPLPPRLVLVSIVNVELVVSREILDLVQHLGLDFHLDEPRDEVKGEGEKRRMNRLWFSDYDSPLDARFREGRGLSRLSRRYIAGYWIISRPSSAMKWASVWCTGGSVLKLRKTKRNERKKGEKEREEKREKNWGGRVKGEKRCVVYLLFGNVGNVQVLYNRLCNSQILRYVYV